MARRGRPRKSERPTDLPLPPDVQMPEGMEEFEQTRQALRRLVLMHRDRYFKAEAALAALEGRVTLPNEPRLNKAIKEYLFKAGPKVRTEVLEEMMRLGIVSDTRHDRARVTRSLKQCVNSATLSMQDGKFAVPPGTVIED